MSSGLIGVLGIDNQGANSDDRSEKKVTTGTFFSAHSEHQLKMLLVLKLVVFRLRSFCVLYRVGFFFAITFSKSLFGAFVVGAVGTVAQLAVGLSSALQRPLIGRAAIALKVFLLAGRT